MLTEPKGTTSFPVCVLESESSIFTSTRKKLKVHKVRMNVSYLIPNASLLIPLSHEEGLVKQAQIFGLALET